MQRLLHMQSITKEFPGTRALDGVELDLFAGEVLALMGENGAGKSTLMKILSGVWPAGSFEGTIELGTSGAAPQAAQFGDTRDAHAAGIAMIHQELALFPELTVAEHLVLDTLPSVIRWKPIFEEAQSFLDGLGFGLKAHSKVKELSIGSRQLVEIARALHRDAKVIVFDEPTSALSESEVERLYGIIRRLKAEGRGILYITHRMDEVFELADRIQVLRDGKNVETMARAPRAELEPRLLKAMVGREIKDVYPAKVQANSGAQASAPALPPALEVRGLSLTRPSGQRRIEDVSFVVRPGEVVGMGGLLGSGRSEILEALFGHYHADGPRGPGYRVEGEVRVGGVPLRLGRPVDSLRAGMAFLSEDRKGSGLMLGQSIFSNLMLATLAKQGGGVFSPLDLKTEASRGAHWKDELRIRSVSGSQAVGELSGGNQQKVVLAKWLETGPKVLFLDEPTRGVDIGAKAEIYQWIARLASEGMGIVLVSSEMPELLGLSHRVLVLRSGRISAELDAATATQEQVMEAASL